ncbi:MAG TPA: molybdenum cofactor guanylyltransferase [Ferruginibacter sp.]|nr:molybdenum cofactor guanylyltransferase [Ferruginibacter sp.]HMP20157.1 molybdenum cofactor guanylyltransferase [Ferruginibacter sp.]
MVGLVLCGGQSLRMGTDKGLLQQHGGISWAEVAARKLASFNMPVYFSVNQQQQQAYAAHLNPGALITDCEHLQLKGPLLGLLTAHLHMPEKDIAVLACDMPLMNTDVLHKLYTTYTHEPQYDAYHFTNNGEPEPLCAIYRSALLAKILCLLQQDELAKHSMKYMIGICHAHSMPLLDEEKNCFQNFNAHADLNGL